MAGKLEVWFKTRFGGTWTYGNGWTYNHPGTFWNWINFTLYRIYKFILLKWHGVQIWYYKRKMR